ncbi:MAG: DUF4390 domain-containing protein [Gammaproteobacteria bacterium]|nr:DUF4390 domain-containing protein [Gammaproteobacteria bacterium]
MLMSVFQYSLPGLNGRLFRLAGLGIWLLFVPVHADVEADEAFEIETALFALDNTLLELDLVVDINLPDYIRVAINQGFAVPLMFEVEIFTNRNYWFDKKVVTLKQQYLLHFLPMLSSYVVYDVNAVQRHYFDDLSAAVRYIEVVYNYPMLDINNFAFDREYYARTRFGIDSDELPIPLKPGFFWGGIWNVHSDWYSFEMISFHE